MYRPYVDAGYTVYVLSRRRGMPLGHTIRDMADDLAEVIRDELGGRVEVVVGLSYGGLVAQYLAADHPGCCDAVVLLGSACQLSDWVKDADHRMALAAARGDATGVGTAVAEYVVATPRLGWLRRLTAQLIPSCTTIVHRRRGHVGAAMDRRVPRDGRRRPDRSRCFLR